MGRGEMEWEVVNWICMAQNSDWWQAVMNKAMKIMIP
jgi:hypothetical protein